MPNDEFAQWLAENPEPSLADLVRRHGDYSTRKGWAEYDHAVTAWQRLRRERYGSAMARALLELRHDVARRAARIRRQSR